MPKNVKTLKTITLLKNNVVISYIPSKSNSFEYRVKVLGKAGKNGKNGKGKHKNWLNIAYLEEPYRSAVDWDTVESWKFSSENEESLPPGENVDTKHSENEPESGKNTLLGEDTIALFVTDEFNCTKKAEIINWLKNNVFEEIQYTGQQLVGTRWVLSNKNDVKKARLVAKGFQDKTSETDPTLRDSPTCSKESLKSGICIMISNGWELGCLDVKAAFLQCLPISREIFIDPPKEFRKDLVVWGDYSNTYTD